MTTETEPQTNGAERSELENKIIEQIEYYFGEINMARDKFLQEETKKDDGWVELSTMLKFARLAKMTSEAKVIVDALKKSPNNLIEVSEDGLKIRRNPEKALPSYDLDYVRNLMTQSLYIKHFPKDVTLDDIQAFFKKNLTGDVKVTNIIMRNYVDKLTNKKMFKGSIFATFDSKENAEKFLNEYKDEKLKYNEESPFLIIRWQEDYNEEKREEMRSKQNKKAKKNNDENVEGDEQEEKKDKPKIVIELPTGTLLKVLNTKEPLTREDIREHFESLDNEEIVDFVEFMQGSDFAVVRYKNKDSAEKVLNKLESKEFDLKGVKLTVESITGEEETTILDRMKMELFNRRQKLMNEKKSGKRFGKKGGKGHKRSKGHHSGPNKRSRQDDD